MPLTASFGDEIAAFADKLRRREPFTLVRAGDGEYVIMRDRPFDIRSRANGEFRHAPGDARCAAARQLVLASTRHCADQYYVGLACPCCIKGAAAQDMRQLSGLPESQLTWANLWVNHNYVYFCEQVVPLFATRTVYLVCHEAADIARLPFPVADCWRVGADAWVEQATLVDELPAYVQSHGVTDAVFLFCCGPLANMLGYSLAQAGSPNTHLDIGSPLDPWLFPGRRGLTRRYLQGGSQRRKVCIW